MTSQFSQKLLLGMEPSAVRINDAIALYHFLDDLRRYQGSRLLWMDVTMNHKEKKFGSITFTSFDFNDEQERIHVLDSAASNTALVTIFNSFYLLYQQRKKKDRQSFTPSYWMQILDEKYSVFAQIRTRKLKLLID